jgi:hypothetical protein
MKAPVLVYLPPSQTPRPDGDLADVALGLDWKSVSIVGADEAANGRIFKWLMGQVQLARMKVRDDG